MDLGIIGNCQYNALIDRNANVKWLCWPRLDSSFVFGSLIAGEQGGEFRVSPNSGVEGQQSYIQNTNILVTTFEDATGKFEVVDFAPRFYQNDRYYKPTMHIRIVRPLKGRPIVEAACRPTYEYGKAELGQVVGSNHINFKGTPQELRLTTSAPLTYVLEGKPFVLESVQYFVLTWGRPLEAAIESTCHDFLSRTIRYWRTWIKHSYIPRDYQEPVIRSALVLKLHQFEDTGAIIASTTTSLPEAEGTVRNWDYRYCWLRDALFSLQAMLRLTHFEEMEGFVSYLRNVVEICKVSGRRLQPVYSVDGNWQLTENTLDELPGYKGHKPVRIGNQAHEHLQYDIFGEMILAISQLFLDKRFSQDSVSYPTDLLSYLITQIEEKIAEPDAGLWEFRGTEQIHTFTILMHWIGGRKALDIAEVNNLPDIAKRAQIILDQTQKMIDERAWNKDLNAFTQQLDGRDFDASVLMLVNLGYLSGDDPRAKGHVETIAKELHAKNGLIHRYKHTDDFGETHNVFTICCFWLVEAFARIGETERARELFERLLSYSNSLGLYSEDLDPRDLSQWGNYPQTYSHVGLINAAFALSRPWE